MPTKSPFSPKKVKPAVTVSIVSYKTRDKTLRLLKSIYKFTKNIPFEVIVVDNYTQDGLAQTLKNDYPQVRYLSRPDNLWHTGGHNLAFDKSSAPYFFILNSDVYFKSNLLKQLYDYMEKH